MGADLPPLLRVPDLAELLGITPNGVRALIARGEIPASKLGRQLIVRREALLAHLKAAERARRTPAPDPVEVLQRMTRTNPLAVIEDRRVVAAA